MIPDIARIVLAPLIAFGLVYITIPPIIRISKAKNLFDYGNDMKVHGTIVPAIGGVAIFIGFILSTIITTDGITFESLKYIIAALIVMFFFGLKDDILIISPVKKFAGEIVSALLLILLGHIQITNLHGIFGIHEINQTVSILLTLFVILGIVNAYNLIDGIDGLASALGILASLIFGTWFYMAGQMPCAVMSFALAGSLVAFFRFNVFGKQYKLFMGDTGSLIVGLVISTLAIRFNQLNLDKTIPYVVNHAPAVTFAILFVPLFDMVRVFTIRLAHKKSPFHGDNNHLHHRLLTLFPNHLTSTLIIVGFNILILALAFFLHRFSLSMYIGIFILLAAGIYFASMINHQIKISKEDSIPHRLKKPKLAWRSFFFW